MRSHKRTGYAASSLVGKIHRPSTNRGRHDWCGWLLSHSRANDANRFTSGARGLKDQNFVALVSGATVHATVKKWSHDLL